MNLFTSHRSIRENTVGLKARVPIRETKKIIQQRWLDHWTNEGYSLPICPPLTGDALLHFSTDTGWEGILNLRDWFAAVTSGQEVEFASHFWSTSHLMALFSQSVKPLDGQALPPALAYNKVFAHDMVDDEKKQSLNPCAAFSTSRGMLWLYRFKQQIVPPKQGLPVNLAKLPFLLTLRIGRSQLSYKWFKNSQVGDVLLIQSRLSDFIVANKKIGNFAQTEEGYMFEVDDEDENDNNDEWQDFYQDDDDDDDDDDIDDNEDVDDKEDETEDHSFVKEEKKSLLDEIPVKIDFIFHQKIMTLSEIKAISQGDIIHCDANAEKNILVLANGMKVAKGQIVWIDEQPGVEITHLYRGKKGAK